MHAGFFEDFTIPEAQWEKLASESEVADGFYIIPVLKMNGFDEPELPYQLGSS